MRKAATLIQFFRNSLKLYPKLFKENSVSRSYAKKAILNVSDGIEDFVRRLFFKLPAPLSNKRRSLVANCLHSANDFLTAYSEACKTANYHDRNFLEAPKIEREREIASLMRVKLKSEKLNHRLIHPRLSTKKQLLLIGKQLEEIFTFSMITNPLIISLLLALFEKILQQDKLKLVLYRLSMLDFNASIEGETQVPLSIFGETDEAFSKKIGEEISMLVKTILNIGESSSLFNYLGQTFVESNKKPIGDDIENFLKRSLCDECMGVKVFLILNHLLFEDNQLIQFEKTLPEEDFSPEILGKRLLELFEKQGPKILITPIAKIASLDQFFYKISEHLIAFSETSLLSAIFISFLLDGVIKSRENGGL